VTAPIIGQMAQKITIYLDGDTLELVTKTTRDSGVSRSRWIAEAIQLRMRAQWPEAVRALSGSWKDFPSAEEIRARQGKDSRRRRL